MEKIQISKKKAWGAVPEALVQDRRLGHPAKVLGVWLTLRPDGWKVHKEQAKDVLGLGEKNWDKACKELTEAGYLSRVPVRVKGQFKGHEYCFDPQPEQLQTTSTGGTASAPGATAHGGAAPAGGAHLTQTLGSTTFKQKQQHQIGGGCEFQVVEEKGMAPMAPGILSSIIGITGPQGQQLDQLANGASVEQLQRLRAALAMGRASNKIKDEGAWLAMMAKKAVAGGITDVNEPPGGGGVASVLDELKAVSVPAGTVIMVGEKSLVVEHADGVPRVLANGLWIGAQRSLKVLQRLHAGELSTSSGGAS